MLIQFNSMPENARVWVYQANRNFAKAESVHIQQVLENQIDNWAAHGAGLSGAVKVFFNRFIIIALDEHQNAASGCSIDASTHWLKELASEMSLDFFDRSITFWHNDELKSIELPQIKNFIEEGIITPDTIIFNNLVVNLDEIKNKWQTRASESWMKRFFKLETIL
jgi:hypothetical protein